MSALADVIPLKPYQNSRLVLAAGPQLPEPARLYALVVLAFVLHQPTNCQNACKQCTETWPCPQVRLAYRLREAF